MVSARGGERAWTTFDVLKGILASLGDADKISAEMPRVHASIHKLAGRKEFRELLKGYVFDQRSYFPYSRELQTDLLNLELAGHLSVPNPALNQYQLTRKLVQTFAKDKTARFSDRQIDLLERMAACVRQDLTPSTESA